MLVREVFNSVYPARGNYLDVVVIPDDEHGFRICRIFVDSDYGVVRQFFVTQDARVPYENSEVDFVTTEKDNELWIWL